MMIIITKIHVAKFQEKTISNTVQSSTDQAHKYPQCKRRNFRSSNPTKLPIMI